MTYDNNAKNYYEIGKQKLLNNKKRVSLVIITASYFTFGSKNLKSDYLYGKNDLEFRKNYYKIGKSSYLFDNVNFIFDNKMILT